MPLTHQYPNPPVAEAVCEILFVADPEWDVTSPGRFYPLIQQEYPAKPKQQAVIGAEVLPTESGGFRVTQLSKVMFSSGDAEHQLGIGPLGLSIHESPPYAGWDADMRPRIERVVRGYAAFDPARTVQRIGIRYINALPHCETIADARRFVRFVPEPVEGLPHRATNFLARAEFVYDDETRVIVAVGPGQREDVKKLVLDIDVVRMGLTLVLEPDLVLAIIDQSKAKLTEAFEALITPEAKEIFDAH